jgi:hypothetical protein
MSVKVGVETLYMTVSWISKRLVKAVGRRMETKGVWKGKHIASSRKVVILENEGLMTLEEAGDSVDVLYLTRTSPALRRRSPRPHVAHEKGG